MAWLRRLFGRLAGASAPQPGTVIGTAAAPPADRAAARPAPGGDFASIFGPSAALVRAPAARRTVVIIGNCVAETMHAGLASAPLAAARYEFFAVPLHVKAVDDGDVRDALGRASHVFVQAVAADRLAAIRAAAPDAQVSLYPDVVLRSLWPFDEQSCGRDPRVDANPEGTIRHHDGALARLRVLEPDKKKRLARYAALDFEAAAALPRIIAAQQRFLEEIDTKTDVKLGRFVLRHFRDVPLFYNSTHPAPALFQELCDYAWGKLELAGQASGLAGLDTWQRWSIPVHPLVARQQGVTWAHERTRYRYETLGEITWREWVEAYIEHLG